MMQSIVNYENADLARLKSAAASAVAATTEHSPDQGVPVAHPMLDGVDAYAHKALQGNAPEVPTTRNASDPEAAEYLAYLTHHKAHAVFCGNKQIEAQMQTQLDDFTFGNPAWQQMFDEYVKYFWAYPGHSGGKLDYRSWRDPQYGGGSFDYGCVKWQLPSDATIALIGDIGTGTDVAAAVLASALSFKPDAILHVGDVYYSGTEQEFETYFLGLLNAAFTAAGHRPPVYTLPGNHEYFCGAFPYFRCLDEGRLVNRPDQQQQASYFRLTSEDDGWQILGMDTGYHGHYLKVAGDQLDKALGALQVKPSDAYDPQNPPPMVYVRSDEVDWHRHHLSQFSGRSLLFGHHQLYSGRFTVGVAPDYEGDINWLGVNTALWQAFGPYFDKVAAWFWGHEHNLCIFEDCFRPKGWPPDSSAPDNPLKTLAKGRCIGHSAIPVQEKETPYEEVNPVPIISGTQLDKVEHWYNRGFEILKLNGAGQPAHCTYYQIAGADPAPLKVYSEDIG